MSNRQHRPQWRKSTFSGTNGSCVEFAPDAEGVLMRDSKLGDESPVLVFDRGSMADFLDRAKRGEFDDLC
jgi:Domain of unknown function (DUF397)